MQSKLLLAPLAAALATGSAVAADLPVKARPAPLPVGSWSGFYLGGNVGGVIGQHADAQSAAFSSAVLGPNRLLTTADTRGGTGAVLGGQIGYNWQVSPRWLVGVEADWQWTSLKTSGGSCTPPAGTAVFFSAGANGFGYCLSDEQKLTNFGTARARAGVLVRDTLWYATGGAAWGTVKDSVAFAGSAQPVIFPGGLQPGPFFSSGASSSQTRLGWTVGAGAETVLSSQWSAKLEYLYVDLGHVGNSFAIPINPAFGPAFTSGAASASQSAHITDHVVRVGLNYHLSPLPTGPAAAVNLLKAPPPAAWNWTGVYVGADAGGIIGVNSDAQTAAFSSPTLGANTLLSTFGKQAGSGALLGGQIGYNRQLSSRWLVGLEADWQWTSLKTSATSCTPNASTVAFFGAGANGFGYCLSDEHKLTNFGTARARAGVLAYDTLWYATGGAAWGTVKNNFAYAGTANPTIFPPALQPGPFLPSSASFSHTRLGWTAGAGAETKLDARWSAKLEYLYADLGHVSDAFAIPINPAFGAPFTSGTATASRTSHVTDHVMRVGVNYKIY